MLSCKFFVAHLFSNGCEFEALWPFSFLYARLFGYKYLFRSLCSTEVSLKSIVISLFSDLIIKLPIFKHCLGLKRLFVCILCFKNLFKLKGIPMGSQFTEECVLREINKCYIGLLPQSQLPQRHIKISALSKYAHKLSSNIFNEAKIQAQTVQFQRKAESKRKVAETFADTVMNTLVKGLPVSLKQRKPNVPGSSSSQSTLLGHQTNHAAATQLSGSDNVTVTFTFADDGTSSTTSHLTTQMRRNDTLAFSQESPPNVAPILHRSQALEDFADSFLSSLFKIVIDQLFPKITRRMFVSKRRRSSSRTVSLSQSFSLYDIVRPNGEDKETTGNKTTDKGLCNLGLLRPVNVLGNKADEQSNFFLGDIEEVSADFITDTSDWSSRGSAKYKSKLPLSKSVAAETFYRGRKFASIRDQYSNIMATQILAEAIASYINTLAKKRSSTGSSLSPRLESSLSDDARRGSGIHTVEEYSGFLSDKIVVEALQFLCSGRAVKSLNDRFFPIEYEDLDDDSYSIHSNQASNRGLNPPSFSSSNQRRRSNASLRRASGTTVSSNTMNERLYSFFVITLFFKVWSLLLTVTQSFSTHYRRREFDVDLPRDSNLSAIQLEIEGENTRGDSKRASLDLSVDEHGNQIMTSSARPRLQRGAGGRKGKEKMPLNVSVSDRRLDMSNENKATVTHFPSFPVVSHRMVGDSKAFGGSSFSLNTVLHNTWNTYDFPGRRDLTTVATQTIGSVSFGGDAQFKFFILWISASLAGQEKLLFHPSGNSSLNDLEKIVCLVKDNDATAGDLFELLRKYCDYVDLFKSYDSNKQPKSFFSFLENFYS